MIGLSGHTPSECDESIAWSHRITTGNGMPAFSHHVFICENTRDEAHPRGSCDPKRKEELRAALKAELKKARLDGLVRMNHAGCLDQCEHGPTLVIYPQGIWYGHVSAADAPRIVHETIVAGNILEDLLIADSCLNNPDCPHRRKQEAQ